MTNRTYTNLTTGYVKCNNIQCNNIQNNNDWWGYVWKQKNANYLSYYNYYNNRVTNNINKDDRNEDGTPKYFPQLVLGEGPAGRHRSDKNPCVSRA